MRRRDVLLLPVIAGLPGVAVAGAPAVVHRVALQGPEPLMQLARAWRYGPVRRVLVRPEAAWWPSPLAVPDRWQAWLDLADGGAVHVVARGGTTGRAEDALGAQIERLLLAE